MELEIGTTIPVHQVEVRLKPHIQTEPIIPNEDGSPPTPSPPASPRPNSDDEDTDTPQANNIITTTGSHNQLPQNTLLISHLEKLTPLEANALSVPDPVNISATKIEKYNMQQEQDKDPNIYKVKTWLRDKIIPETAYENHEIQQYARQLSRLILTNEGILFRKFYHHDGKNFDAQLVIPKHLREETMAFLHNAKTEGHRGSRKTLNSVENNSTGHFFTLTFTNGSKTVLSAYK